MLLYKVWPNNIYMILCSNKPPQRASPNPNPNTSKTIIKVKINDNMKHKTQIKLDGTKTFDRDGYLLKGLPIKMFFNKHLLFNIPNN